MASRRDLWRSSTPISTTPLRSSPEAGCCGGERRRERAARLLVTAYLAGGALYCAAGLLNPVSPLLVLISAAAASFGGTSAFAWMAELLRSPAYATADVPAPAMGAERGWWTAAFAAALVFVLVLGPGIRF